MRLAQDDPEPCWLIDPPTIEMKHILFTVCLVLFAQLVPCSGQNSTKPAAGAKALESEGRFSGKVLETTNTAGYTYVLVDTGAKKLWAAAPAFTVKVGDTAAISGGMPMANYHSKSLNRDFDVVYFTGGVVVNGAQAAAGDKGAGLPKDHPPIGGEKAALPKDHPAIGGQTPALPQGHPSIGGEAAGSAKEHPPIASGAAPTKSDLSGLKKAPGGKTVAEIFAGKSKLGGQSVKVRGKVVKFNAMIMGKNWLHLQDGTGSPGSNDLVVTTSTDVKVGDTVLVTGKVTLNKDFGSGYSYVVIIEDAKVVVE